MARKKKEKAGGTISFLPSDIDGLFQKLKLLLLAEFQGGNKTTSKELVAVLDEFKRQDGITEEEYTAINLSL